MNISIVEALRWAADVLDQNGVAEARREAGALLSHVIGKDRTFLISHAEDLIGENEQQHFEEAVMRRAAGEPAQYIIGSQDFYGRAFRVTPAVLIPRPETELLVEAALEVMKANAEICDVGTGSGCIAITLLCERDNARAVALDVSEAALEIARENASAWSVGPRIKLVTSDCFTALNESTDKFNLIVSNPPYVAANVISGLQREVREHEPLVALSPGEDGLSVIRRLVNDSPRFLRDNGHLIMEIGFDQGEAVQQLVDKNVWILKEIRPDLQCIPRIVVLQKK
ncbi:MAG TPA: peptide chain release factor N(5)-glutamine methyltransferase, partial [Pyrinomonadaceae bacterium]|nr:peptide chain release factor N(5)-glutamine methyltransferase [Pyrinomonadaceae bacterium]